MMGCVVCYWACIVLLDRISQHCVMPQEYFGWSCAQRRPLRALAHMLHMFAPQALIVLDDDTFLNMGILKSLWPHFMKLSSADKPVVFGDNWHQILLGGAGYLLLENSLNRLRGHFLHVPNDTWFPSRFRVNEEMGFFPKTVCPRTCISKVNTKPPASSPPAALAALHRIDNRVIDFCVNLFSSEHTCYHRSVSAMLFALPLVYCMDPHLFVLPINQYLIPLYDVHPTPIVQ